MWKLKHDTYELIYETERLTDIEKNLWLPRGRGLREGSTGSLGLTEANYYI